MRRRRRRRRRVGGGNEEEKEKKSRRRRRRRRRVRGWHNIGTNARRRNIEAVSMLNDGWSIKLTAQLCLLPCQ
jgi:hypothetical protein